jgi:fumarylpyruvate hydrolase
MNYVLPPPSIRSLAIAGTTDRFPINRVFCVGRNYAAHAREMGKDPAREPPFFFMKPANAVVDAEHEASIAYPRHTTNYQHEIELVVAIGVGGSQITAEQALQHVFGYAVGLDMTRRDLQLAARDKGRPWEFGKSFSPSAPIGAITPVQRSGHIHDAAIRLKVGDSPRQSSDISQLIWPVPECIAYLSDYEDLEPGDLIMTGTPEGVAAVSRADLMIGTIEGLSPIAVRVT